MRSKHGEDGPGPSSQGSYWERRPPFPVRTLLLTPLIDVVFLVTIFFVINTSFSHTKMIEIDLPHATTAFTEKGKPLSISVLGDGRILLRGKEVPLEALSTLLTEEQESVREEGVALEGDADVPYHILIAVMDQIRFAGITSLSLVTTAKKGEL